MPCQAEIFNESDLDLTELIDIANEFLPHAQEVMGFSDPVTVSLISDEENSINPLGKTAYYDPMEKAISLFVDGRHTKDILRSLSHELVHHTQNCNGMFDDIGEMGPGYAQEDDHLRGMEREAYELGNMCFRDWEDEYKKKQEWQLNENKFFDTLQRMWGNRGQVKQWPAQAAQGAKRMGKAISRGAGQAIDALTDHGGKAPSGFFSAGRAGLIDAPMAIEKSKPHFSEDNPGPNWDCRPIPAKLGQSFDPYAWRTRAGESGGNKNPDAVNESESSPSLSDRGRGYVDAHDAMPEDPAEPGGAGEASSQSNCPENVDRRDTINNWLNWIFMHDGEDIKKAYYSLLYDDDVGTRRKMDVYHKYEEIKSRGRPSGPSAPPEKPEEEAGDYGADPAVAAWTAAGSRSGSLDPSTHASARDALAKLARGAPAAVEVEPDPFLSWPDDPSVSAADTEPVLGTAPGLQKLVGRAIATAVKKVYNKRSGKAGAIDQAALTKTLMAHLQSGQPINYQRFERDLINSPALSKIEVMDQGQVAKELAKALRDLQPHSGFKHPIQFDDDRGALSESLTFSEELRIRSAVQSAMGKIEEKAKARWSEKNITLEEVNRFAKLAGIKSGSAKLLIEETEWRPWKGDFWTPAGSPFVSSGGATAQATGHVYDVVTPFSDTNYSADVEADRQVQYASQRAREAGRSGTSDEDYEVAAERLALPANAWDAWSDLVVDLPGQEGYGTFDAAHQKFAMDMIDLFSSDQERKEWVAPDWAAEEPGAQGSWAGTGEMESWGDRLIRNEREIGDMFTRDQRQWQEHRSGVWQSLRDETEARMIENGSSCLEIVREGGVCTEEQRGDLAGQYYTYADLSQIRIPNTAGGTMSMQGFLGQEGMGGHGNLLANMGIDLQDRIQDDGTILIHDDEMYRLQTAKMNMAKNAHDRLQKMAGGRYRVVNQETGDRAWVGGVDPYANDPMRGASTTLIDQLDDMEYYGLDPDAGGVNMFMGQVKGMIPGLYDIQRAGEAIVDMPGAMVPDSWTGDMAPLSDTLFGLTGPVFHGNEWEDQAGYPGDFSGGAYPNLVGSPIVGHAEEVITNPRDILRGIAGLGTSESEDFFQDELFKDIEGSTTGAQGDWEHMADFGAPFMGMPYVPPEGSLSLEDEVDQAFNDVRPSTADKSRFDSDWLNDQREGNCLTTNSTDFSADTAGDASYVANTGGEQVCGNVAVAGAMMRRERDMSFISTGGQAGTPGTVTAQSQVRTNFITHMRKLDNWDDVGDRLAGSIAVEGGLFSQTREEFGIGMVDDQMIEDFFSPRVGAEEWSSIAEIIGSDTGSVGDLSMKQRDLLRRVLDEEELSNKEEFEREAARILGYNSPEEALEALGTTSLKSAVWQRIATPAMTEADQMSSIQQVFTDYHGRATHVGEPGVDVWLREAGYTWADGTEIQSDDISGAEVGALGNLTVQNSNSEQVPILHALTRLAEPNGQPWAEQAVTSILLSRTIDPESALMSAAASDLAEVEELYAANLILSQQAAGVRAILEGGAPTGRRGFFGDQTTTEPLPGMGIGAPATEHDACIVAGQMAGTNDPTRSGCVISHHDQSGAARYRIYDNELIANQDWEENSVHRLYYDYLDQSDYGTIRQLESLIINNPAASQGTLLGIFPSETDFGVGLGAILDHTSAIAEGEKMPSGTAMDELRIQGVQTDYGFGLEYLKIFQYQAGTSDGARDRQAGGVYTGAMSAATGDDADLLRAVFANQATQTPGGENIVSEDPDTVFEVVMTIANPGLPLVEVMDEQGRGTGTYEVADMNEATVGDLMIYHARIRREGLSALYAAGQITEAQYYEGLERFGEPALYTRENIEARAQTEGEAGAPLWRGGDPMYENSYADPAEFVNWWKEATMANAQTSPEASMALESFHRSNVIVENLATNARIKSSLQMSREDHFRLFLGRNPAGVYGGSRALTSRQEDKYYYQYEDDPRYTDSSEWWGRANIPGFSGGTLDRHFGPAGYGPDLASRSEHDAFNFYSMWDPEEGATDESRAWLMRYAPELVYRHLQAEDTRSRTLAQGQARAAANVPGMSADSVYYPAEQYRTTPAERMHREIMNTLPRTPVEMDALNPADAAAAEAPSRLGSDPAVATVGSHGPSPLRPGANQHAYNPINAYVGFPINGEIVSVGQILPTGRLGMPIRRSLRAQGYDLDRDFPGGVIIIHQPEELIRLNPAFLNTQEGQQGLSTAFSQNLDRTLEYWEQTMDSSSNYYPPAREAMPAVLYPDPANPGQYLVHIYTPPPTFDQQQVGSPTQGQAPGRRDMQQGMQENIGRIRQIKDIELIKEQIRKAFSDKRINLPRKKLEEIIRKQIITSLQGDK